MLVIVPASAKRYPEYVQQRIQVLSADAYSKYGFNISGVVFDELHTQPADHIKPDKARSTEKMDGIVALIVALDRAIRCGGGEDAESIYDERGLLFI